MYRLTHWDVSGGAQEKINNDREEGREETVPGWKGGQQTVGQTWNTKYTDFIQVMQWLLILIKTFIFIGGLIWAIWSLYCRSKSLVRITSRKSDLFPVRVCLCPLSLVLFIIFMDNMDNRISRCSQAAEGIKFGGLWFPSAIYRWHGPADLIEQWPPAHTGTVCSRVWCCRY